MQRSNLANMIYTPHFLAPTPFLQFLVYLSAEAFVQKFFPPKYEREEFDLADGGVMAVDWTIEEDGTAYPQVGKDGKLTKPILLLFPGLSGGNDNFYTISLIERAKKQGYKCGTVIMRGCCGL